MTLKKWVLLDDITNQEYVILFWMLTGITSNKTLWGQLEKLKKFLVLNEIKIYMYTYMYMYREKLSEYTH